MTGHGRGLPRVSIARAVPGNFRAERLRCLELTITPKLIIVTPFCKRVGNAN
jgi:hypothetical protein